MQRWSDQQLAVYGKIALKAVAEYTKSIEFRNLLKFLYKVGYKWDHRSRKIGKETFWVVL
jgi:hypothetical protein